jgi:diguanylate cyclase (GGDEF)-like protein
VSGVGRLHDAHRLSVLHDLDILDTDAEPAYDDLARLASICCNSKIAAINFVDADRHWTKAIVGVEDGQGASVDASLSFCAATVASAEGQLSVPDTRRSERWRSHPLVAEGPAVGFYAGASIVVADEPIGVVCVFGGEPRVLTEREEQALRALARQASAQLELRMRNADLRELAVKDPLTGLANRRMLDDRLQLAIAEHKRRGGDVGVLFCDIDDFKSVNDRYGHEAGDHLLRTVADRLREGTRGSDTVARISGDEFVVVCPGLESAEEFDLVVSRIEAAVNTTDGDGDPDASTCRLCIGAVLLAEGETSKSVLNRADKAMYARKTARRTAVVVP